ncbi:hypothetical protein NLX71_14095 [Paenibacillus sp. MZ04-78.2]|uniref:hypothetical protein n=1 Tax=Paenibacillus sp. MZ04-78.2 TaxID=2962034 RepID=UPI0020B7FD41|nr:hypothetical protein [Paenibacillus sp. MZ04-78.2]MCP3774427.1 hypothetical protein [Paenibacillus sp. MZ04-78.2]
MDYFWLKQDDRYTDVPVLEQVRSKVDTRDIRWRSAHKIPDPIVFYVKAGPESEFLDVMDRQLYLVSEKLKQVLAMYEPDAWFKYTPLLDLKGRQQKHYFLPIFPEDMVLSLSSEWSPDRSIVKKPILWEEKLKGKKIVRVQESDSPLVAVRLDVAESILRRDFAGVRLEKANVE